MSEKLKGTVVKSTGNLYRVRTNNNQIIDCKLRGKFRIHGIKTTNPVVVGDYVLFIKDPQQPYGLITDIENRKNYITRKSTNLSHISHILAANLDCVFLIVTIDFPQTPLGFVDRFLTATESFRIKSILIFNKIDLYTEENLLQLEEWKSMYEKIGYTCLSVSAVTHEGLDDLKNLMKNKVSFFGGQSGVGKSTLINALDSSLNLSVGDISDYYKKGRHTTTFAEMFDLSFGAQIIDSPGIREFGLIQYEKEEVSHYFPEMLRLLPQCKFNNCTHTHEPQCAVKEALEKGEISETRYFNYISIIENEDIDLKDWMLK